MRLSGHTLGTPDHSVEDALRLFAEAGLDGAEVIWQDDYLSALPEGDVFAARRAREVGDRVGVPIVALTPYMTGLNSEDPAVRARDMDRFRTCIDTAVVIGASLIRSYAGSFLAGDENRATKWQLLVDSLRELGDYAADRGVTLCVENHFNTMTVSAAHTALLLSDVDSPGVAALYDQANLAFTHDEGFEEAITTQTPLIGNVHVKDLVFVDPEKPFIADATHRVKAEDRNVRSRVVGDGILDWEAILRRLHAAGYDGNLSLEYEYRWHPADLPTPQVGFTLSVQRLRPILNALGGDGR